MADDPEAAKKALREEFKSADDAIYSAAFDNSRNAYPKTMRLTGDMTSKMLDFFKSTSGKEFSGSADSFFINTYVDQAGKN